MRLVTNIHRSVVNRTFLLSMALCLFVAGCIDSTHQSNNSTDVPVTTAELPELLPLQTLLAPAEYVAPQISPNGRWISYIAPLDGVPNFFVAPSDQPKSGQAVTSFTDRGVQATDISGVVMYSWHADSEHIIYPVDYDGDENWDIHIVNIVSGEERNLTPSPGIKTQIIASDRNSPNEVVILVNERHPMLPDVYRLNLQTGLRENILMNPGKVLGFLADDNLKLRLAVAINAEGGIDISRISDDKEFDTFMQISAEDLPALTTSSSQKIIRLNQSNEHLYLYDVEGRDTTAFISLNLSSGEKKVIAQDKRADLAGILYEPLTNKPLAYATNWTRTSWHAIDSSVAPDIEFLNQAAEGDWNVVSQTDDNNKWIVQDMLSHKPVRFFIYDRIRKSSDQLFTSTPALEGLPLSKLHPYIVQTDDGLDLVSYLLLPPWTDPDEDGRPSEPLPVIVLVHGGPSDERAQFAYGPFLHWLANRGYGILYVNFRGSAGFGKAYMNGQTREWGGRMHQDILDQVDWAIREEIVDPAKVAILGGSYGGYEVLVAMTMTPEKFACGIDLVGPSNLEIFMPHWDVDRMSVVLGDPRTEEGRAFLRSRSPINFADQTRHPILIGQGAKDSRVPQDQSDMIVDIMNKNGTAVTYALYPDEGHGLMRTANSFSFWAMSEVFLAGCLDGRSYPIGDALEGSSVEVPVGAELIPGLTEALNKQNRQP
ncbi:MAG TPA: prolyl oligopeptidase family serine peptidase [Pseudomonadales bacterium]|nr:prolyl oligopeptidase family serine peptidase [Pseudomonadales bacterium]MDP6314916.1 prolyl oligopeptidase family serine peptidase [Pseudomonadales bacterium]HJP52466.1 prolyl oligopeptidase family serine peptidase [Pseudomonadales bacterium]